MTKPLQTNERKLPGGISAVRLLRPLAFPAVVSVMLSMSPSTVFGQGDTSGHEDFVRDNRRTESAAAAEAGYSGEELRKLHPTDLMRALQLIDPSICGTDPQEQYGSDPNAVPAAMSLQGVKSFAWGLSSADARPLVIVDGHSESFDRLKDFDMRASRASHSSKTPRATPCTA